MSRKVHILLILSLLSFINTETTSKDKQGNCDDLCQKNTVCIQKCVEYAKNPNRHVLSEPNCGLSRLAANFTDYEFSAVHQRSVKQPIWPWVVSLQYLNGQAGPKKQRPHFCTGVIISEQFILSSAQCVPTQPGGYQVMVGSNSLSIDDKNAKIMEIESVLIPGILYKPWVKRHEDYGTKFHENDDILLIKTADRIRPQLRGNDFVVNSICLPEPQMFVDYKNDKPLGRALIAGWGYEDYEKHLRNAIMEVEVPIISNDMANKILKETRHYFGSEGLYYIYNATLSNKDLASMANVPPGTGDIPQWAFNGDSGSSLVKIINGRAFIFGVNHWISKGQNPISVWARVSYYTKWLDQNMKKTIWQI